MKALFFVLLPVIFSVAFGIPPKERVVQEQVKIENMKLRITFGETELTATLYDNPTTRDLISILPCSTTFEDYVRTEKIFYPRKKLATKNAPEGYGPSTGDITYYAPWGNVAIFYKDFRHSSGLISLGRIEGDGIEKLEKIGNETAILELISE